jgi:hypothetical protein
MQIHQQKRWLKGFITPQAIFNYNRPEDRLFASTPGLDFVELVQFVK